MAISSSTPVPTPNGWVRAADLMIGDKVFAPDGSVQDVTVAHQYIPAKCYKLHLDDGLTIVGDQHLAMMLQTKKWRDRLSQYNNYRGSAPRKKFRRALVKRSLKELYDGTLLHRDGRQEFSVGNCSPVNYPWVDLPVPPYVMGVWYGSMTHSGVHLADRCDIQKVQKRMRGMGFTAHTKKRQNGDRLFEFRPSIKESFLYADALPPTMIPTQYIHSAAEQRRELLDGLLDGGFFRKYKNTCRFVSVFGNYREARLFQELLEGLGYRTILELEPRYNSYSLIFMYDSTNPRFTRRFLTKIVTTEPVQCAHVLAEQPILVGEGFLAIC